MDRLPRKREHINQINQYSYPQLARFKPAKAPGQFSFGTGGQFSIGANTPIFQMQKITHTMNIILGELPGNKK
jgi:hypothetical protein